MHATLAILLSALAAGPAQFPVPEVTSHLVTNARIIGRFVAARHLLMRRYAPAVLLLTDPGKLTGDAKTNFDLLAPLGIPVTVLSAAGAGAAEQISAAAAQADLVIDALLGTGLAGEVRGVLRAAIGVINRAGRPVVAVDIPSGLDANTGAILGECVRADVTVTFAARKAGLGAGSGPAMAGWIVVAEIGIPREILRSFTADGASS